MRIIKCAVLVALVVASGTVIADTIEDTVLMQSNLCVAVKAENAPQKCSDSEPRTLRLSRSVSTAEDGTVSITYSRIEPLPSGLTVPFTAKHAAGAFTLVTAGIEPANPGEQLTKFLEADWASLNVAIQAIRDCAATPAAACSAIRTITKIDAFDWYVSSALSH